MPEKQEQVLPDVPSVFGQGCRWSENIAWVRTATYNVSFVLASSCLHHRLQPLLDHPRHPLPHIHGSIPEVVVGQEYRQEPPQVVSLLELAASIALVLIPV